MGGHTGAQHQGLRHCRPAPALLYGHRHGVRHLVRVRDRARHPGDLPAGKPAWRGGRPLRRSPVPDTGRALLRCAPLSPEPAHHRRFLQEALWAERGSAHDHRHRHFLPRLGRRPDHRAGPGLQRGIRRRDQQAGRHADRLLDHTHLHPVRRHVGRGHHRLPADDRDHAGHAVDRRRGERHGGRRRRRGQSRRAGRQVRLLAGPRSQGGDRLYRRLDHHDARLHPAAGRVPARPVGENREDRRVGLGVRRQPVFPVRLRADVPRLLGDADRSRHGQGTD